MSLRQGARQFFERRDGGGWSNPYVTDGLVAMWDGEWNAGGGVHNQNATVWKDLVGSKDMELAGSVSFGSMSLECSGGYALMSSEIASFITMESVLLFSSAGPGRVAFSPAGRSSYSNDCRWIGMRANGTVSFCGAGKFTSAFPVSAMESVSVAYSSGEHGVGVDASVVYIGGAQVSISGSGLYGLGTMLGNGVSPFSAYPMDGSISTIRIYSRALTSAEIAANYAIDKARFNLP